MAIEVYEMNVVYLPTGELDCAIATYFPANGRGAIVLDEWSGKLAAFNAGMSKKPGFSRVIENDRKSDGRIGERHIWTKTV